MTPASPLEAAAQSVSARARLYTPWAFVILTLAVAAYLGEEIVQPIMISLFNAEHYPLTRALGHVRGNLETSTATVPLLWGLWEISRFMHRLSQGGLWSRAATGNLTRLGIAMVAAGVVAVAIVPAMADLPDARGAKPWPFNALPVALGGIGVVLVFVARLLQIAQHTAERLKQDVDQFI